MAESPQMLGETFAQVLEYHAFMFAEPDAEADLEDGEEQCLQLAIHFQGSVRGRLELAAPEALGATLAANLLGVEPEDTIAVAQAEDALKELLNILCGQLLTSLYGTGLVFELSLPTACPIDRSVWQGWRQRPGTLGLLIDGKLPAWVCLAVEGTR